MVTSSDFISLEYTPDLTRAGIAYACRSLPYTYDRMRGSFLKRLRRITAGIAVELAFRRYLGANNIPHDNLGATPFTDPDRYDIAIGGRRCDIKSFMITQKQRIRQINTNPSSLLEAQALVPTDQMASDQLTDDDIYVFAFLKALVTPNQHLLKQALEANQLVFLIHALPKPWSRPSQNRSLGILVLKSDIDQQIKLELGGQDAERKFLTEQIILEPRQRTLIQKDFHAVSYLNAPQLPDGVIGVHSPILGDTQLVRPSDWGNIWVYGMKIIYAGYMTRGEFRKTAFRIPAGSRVFQYAQTRTENFSLPIGKLHPLGELFSRAKSWSRKD